MDKILKQRYEVTNLFDEKMCIKALESQLSSTIFKELIQNEKEKLIVTFTIAIKEWDDKDNTSSTSKEKEE